MRVYFLSEKTCGLSIGGVYLGLVDGFERSVELDPADGLLCELKPIGDFLPLCFRLDEDFLFAPPPSFNLYFTEEGVAVYAAQFLRADQSLKVLRQERLGGRLLTLTMQGKLQLTLDGAEGFRLVELPDALAAAEFSFRQDGYLLEAENAFALLSHSGEMLLFSEGKLLQRGEVLEAEVPFHDSLGHTAHCKWREGKLTDCTIRCSGQPTPATFALALFESVLIGADILPFLSESLLPKAASLKQYLGDFRSVVLTDRPEKVGLVYERKKGVYDVRYFSVTVEEGKISNITPI